MANTKYSRMKAAEALKALGNKVAGVKVQVATPTKVIDEETGKEKTVFETKMQSLGAEHVLSAKKWANGTVTITTIDGRRTRRRRTPSPTRTREEAAA
jgi:hypothetical protein